MIHCAFLLHNYTPCICGNYDVKDGSNAPEFERQSYAVSVSEDSPIGSTVTTVSATDADSGTNGEITYSIIAGNEDVTFSMDPTSGTIVVAHNLDNKADTSFTLTVQAVDGEAVGTNTSVTVSYTHLTLPTIYSV